MTKVKKKFEKVQIYLLGPHNLLLLSINIYVVFILNVKACKILLAYLYSKDEFVYVFQV